MLFDVAVVICLRVIAFYCFSISTLMSSLGHIQFAWSIRNCFGNERRFKRIKLFAPHTLTIMRLQSFDSGASNFFIHSKSQLKIHYFLMTTFFRFQYHLNATTTLSRNHCQNKNGIGHVRCAATKNKSKKKKTVLRLAIGSNGCEKK